MSTEHEEKRETAPVNPPKKGEEMTLRLEGPAHGGACVAHGDDGHLYFVRGGAPGELVRVRVSAPQRRYTWADVSEVLEPAPGRLDTSVVHGADLHHLSAQAGREWKTQVLADQLQRVGGQALSTEVQALLGSSGPEVQALPGDEEGDRLLGRRTRATFRVGKDRRLGMAPYRSRESVRVKTFPLISPRFEAAGVFSDPAWQKKWRPGQRVTLVSPTASEPVVLVGTRAFHLDGKRASARAKWRVETEFGDRDFDVRADGFWQVHPEAPRVLVEQVLHASGDLTNKNVMELYSGAGLFTRFIEPRLGARGRLVTLEGNAAAVSDAAANLGLVPDDNRVELFTGNVDGEGVRELAEVLEGNVDTVVLDPPRTGAGREIVEAISNTTAKRVVLVACDPAAGARDMRSFLERGFHLTALSAWDLFPHTHHFEVVATLQRENGAAR